MLNLQKNYLEKYQQIYPQSSEWSLIQYKLQLNLGNSSAYLKKVYCVMNPYLNSQFERQNKGLIVSQVYVKPQDLIQSNRIERVCQKGFEFPNTQKGILFNSGQIDIDPNSRSQHQLLVVKVCPRRAYPCLFKKEQQENAECPEGFDSIYYRQDFQSQGIYRHRFRLYKKLQTLPYYVIQFSFNPQYEKKLKTIICKNCQDEPATIYCVTQNVYFCNKCQYQHHKNKISAQHQRKALSQKPILDFGVCHNHKNNNNQLFCKVCNLPMCMNCKIYGDHAQGFMATHQLVKITDYYQGTTKKINQMDPNLEKRKDQLQQLLLIVNTRIQQINLASSKVQNELQQIFKRALTSLKTIVHRKLSYLIADQLQIRRQYDFIQWMESFLKYQYQVLPPNDFLIAWNKHGKLRKQVLNYSNIPPITDVKPNFSVQGSLSILQNGVSVAIHQEWEDQQLKLQKTKTQNQRQVENSQKVQSQFRKKLFIRERQQSKT